MSSKICPKIGNGKIDRTPTPRGLRKIKRISFEVFLSLKELVNSVKVYDSITPRGYREKSTLSRKEPKIIIQNHAHEYKPSNMINVYDSPLWRWRRVNEWHRYINDTIENINGHMIT